MGKTALALHWSHRSTHLFPDGQLHADLHGYDHDPTHPLSPDDVLTDFLQALGAPTTGTPQARAARYRTLLATKTLLVLLDNAAHPNQIRPLLPGAGPSLVLITSRDRMTTLHCDSHRIALTPPPTADALTYLHHALGPRATREPAAAQALVRTCARLPLALAITAETAALRTRTPLSTLATELADEHHLLRAGTRDHNLRTVFSWSLKALTDQDRTLFHAIGLHPGRDCTPGALAALSTLTPTELRRAADALLRVHLVEENGKGGLRAHDLVAAYARDLVTEHLSPASARAAFGRLFHHYRHLLDRASTAPPTTWSTWLTQERHTLEAVAERAESHLPHPTAGAFHHTLGTLHRTQHDLSSALRHLTRATTLLGTTRTHLDRAAAELDAGRHEDARRCLEHIRDGPQRGQPGALVAETRHLRALVSLATGQLPSAVRRALDAARAFTAQNNHHAAATCTLTALTGMCEGTRRTPGARWIWSVDRALLTADSFAAHGLHPQADHATLLAARLLIAHGSLPAARTLLARVPPTSPLHALCEAELLEARGHHRAALELALSTHHTPGPLAAAHRRQLTTLALRAALAEHLPWQVIRVREPPGQRTPSPRSLSTALGHRALLLLATTHHRLIAIVVVSGAAHTVDLDKQLVTENVAKLRRALHAASAVDSPRLTRAAHALAAEAAEALDHVLLTPLRPRISDRDLVVIPPPDLHELPWTVLPSLRRTPVVVTRSAGTWWTAQQRPPHELNRALVVGPPSDLHPSNAQEIAARYPIGEVVPPTRRLVLAAANGADVLHLSARAERSPENPLFSGVRLDDGVLLAHEFGELDRPPDLVVVQHTGLGYARGLLAAGIRVVIAVGGCAGFDVLRELHHALASRTAPAKAVAAVVASGVSRRVDPVIGLVG
ncbi:MULTISPECIES: CHAT domain-containing protein [Actinosynnema]|uniref:CHAT domain-containing protein n=1 Tax=Actinosynnema TaxID=40566 RepID=UPI0020A29A62|nr:CHAT domain-containing protein [Actinosynnema pretiosum]